MYKILFVDDDPLILRRLHQILDWSSMGFQILPDAADGLAALEIMKNEVPDVMICDINMPNMDGLQLAEQVRDTHPNVQCVMLTVNDSFGCAQQALNIGVYHYLLKPIEPKKLESLMQKVLEQLNSSRQQDQYVSHLYNKAMVSEKMIRDKFLNWVVSGRQPLSEQQLIDKFRFYRLPIDAREFEIISLHINAFEKHLLDETDIDDLLGTVTKCVEDTLCDYQNCVVFSDSFYHLNILLGSNPRDLSFSQNVRLICQSLREGLLFNLNLPVTIFYSRRYQGYQNIYRCYYDTKFLSKYTQAVMDMGIISFDDYMRASMRNPIDFDSIRSCVLKQLRTGNAGDLAVYVEQTFMGQAVHGKSPSSGPLQAIAMDFESFNMLRIDLIMTGMMFLQENKTALADVFDKYYDPLTEVMDRDQPADCIEFICGFYRQILVFVRSGKVSSGRRLAEKCVELIGQNISNPDLNVKWLASQLYVNENYLSRQFHKEFSVPLIKYMGQQRLEIAKNYLDKGYTNLQQVAQMVGFTDPLYFSKCFKKQFGVAPSKYR
ncbi:response regulator [Lachnospiraceae bacterium ASD3451]|nr:response regulator [Diplocloster agilis]MBU9743949.1 response regulator [Diplocloster agilis]